MRIDHAGRTIACVLCIMLGLLLTGMAFASSDETSPSDAAVSYEYEITITPPEGWHSTSATVTVEIRDVIGAGYENAAFQRPGEKSWTTISGDTASASITANGTFRVRLNDPSGDIHEESLYIECFDITAPTVTAGIRDKVLHAEASDSQSGVYGISVDGNLYTTLTNGELDLRLEDYANAGATLAVLAIDNMGNCSAVTTIDNPYYVAPTAAPAAMEKPVKTPTATPAVTHDPVIIYTGSLEDTQTTATPAPTAKPAQTAQTAAQTTPSTPASTMVTHTVQDTTADETEAEPAETAEPEEITIEPGTGFSENGNAITRDLLYDKHTNKQFITVETRNGHTFYLVIDYDKISDEDEEQYQTYFLNPVDEADLLALLDDDAISLISAGDADEEAPAVCTCKDKCTVGHIDTTCPVCRTNMTECTGFEATPEPEETTEPETPEEEPEESSGGKVGGVVAVVLIFGIIGGAVYYFLKNKKTKPNTAGSTEFDDYDFGEDDDEDDDNDESDEEPHE